MPITVSIGIVAQPPISGDGHHALGQDAAADEPCIITLARQPVAEHAAEQHGDHLGQRVRRHDQAEVRGRPAEVQDREGQRHRRDRAAEAAEAVPATSSRNERCRAVAVTEEAEELVSWRPD